MDHFPNDDSHNILPDPGIRTSDFNKPNSYFPDPKMMPNEYTTINKHRYHSPIEKRIRNHFDFEYEKKQTSKANTYKKLFT